MKALIFDGSLKEDVSYQVFQKMYDYLEQAMDEVEGIVLRDREIKECLGCFGCWIKEPGQCVIGDEGNVLVEKIINSQRVVYITPVVFGGYSSELKKLLDRIIPLVLPFFKKVKGEVHHQERYKEYPQILIIGLMAQENADMATTFHKLIKRNAMNWYNTFEGGIIHTNQENVEEQLEEMVSRWEMTGC